MVLLTFVYMVLCKAPRGDGLVGSGYHGFCDFIFGVEDIHRYKEACSCLEQ